ncbi:hypothetical protein H6P81_020903 [Aristolochia fimbriata]|uniref:Cytochrome P450 n=1 Tax=Aristolochia fimbriata TaxID=158543 RepID=A0AAV7DVV5_ARIFI|nr:hypothetical protein H6P81_020903 [Aristolochia fimbriata]
MEIESSILGYNLLVALVLLASALWKYYYYLFQNPPTAAVPTPPEVPGRLPFLGHIHRLADNRVPLSRTLAEFADKHGPLVAFRIGVRRAVVASTWETAKQCFTTNDMALASRPTTAAGKYLGFNYANFGFAPYGPYSREIRKIAVLELLSPRRLELLRHVRAAEVDLAMEDLYKLIPAAGKDDEIEVDLKQWFGDLAFNNIVMSVVGKRYYGANVTEDAEEVNKFRRALLDLFFLGGNPVPSDAVPMLEWFDIGGRIRAMKKTAKDLDALASIWLKEHREIRRQLSQDHDDHNHAVPDRDFLDIMLTKMDKSQFVDHDLDTVIKATCVTMILAGTDTTSIALTWALSLLLNNPHVLKKAQEELDTEIGKDRDANESDIKNLPYLRAIIKETMRLHPSSHITGLHLATEDCSVDGYRIPAGTVVLANIWKIQRDPRIWPDPLEFVPERFLTGVNADMDLKGTHFELMPFSAGRRMCPGGPFALQILHLALARLLHEFDVRKPGDEPIDMTESPGITNPKATPLRVLLSPRLPRNMINMQK